MIKQKGIVSLDTETLDKFDDAVILSVGLAFHPLSRLEKPDDIVSTHIKLDVKDQITNYGRKMDKDTTKWWSKQSSESKKVLTPSVEDVKLIDLDSHIREFLDSNNIDGFGCMWFDRRSFDCQKLQYLYDRTFKDIWPKHPFNTFQVYDFFSTFMAWTGDKNGNIPDDVIQGVKHNAEFDAILDLYRYLKISEELGAFYD